MCSVVVWGDVGVLCVVVFVLLCISNYIDFDLLCVYL